MANRDVNDDRPAEPRAIALWRSLGAENLTALEVVFSLLRAQQLVWEQLDAVLKPLDLGVTRFMALTTIMESEDGCRLSDLSSSILVHPTTVTMIVDQLAKQGLVKRQPHATDRRSTLAVITPAGRALAREAASSLDRAGFGISGLSLAKQKRTLDLLADMRRGLGDMWPNHWSGE
jgi:DNA-binding MarR family transcriptional regulator